MQGGFDATDDVDDGLRRRSQHSCMLHLPMVCVPEVDRHGACNVVRQTAACETLLGIATGRGIVQPGDVRCGIMTTRHTESLVA